MKREIILVGGGGHCKSVIDVIELEDKFIIAGIIDKKELIGTKVLDYEVIACDDDLEKLSKIYQYAFITVGQIRTNNIRVKLFNKIKSIGYKIPTIISPLAHISKYSFVDEGTVIHHHSLINADANIGKNCIINSKSLIEHDAIVEDNCHISTGVIINGGTKIEKNSFIGSNSTTKEYITIDGFIKAGSILK